MSRDANVQVGTEQGQITYTGFLSLSCLGSVQTPPGLPGQPVITPGPCRDGEWLWSQAKKSALHIQRLGGARQAVGWGLAGLKLQEGLSSSPEAPALFWLLGTWHCFIPSPVLFSETKGTESKE